MKNVIWAAGLLLISTVCAAQTPPAPGVAPTCPRAQLKASIKAAKRNVAAVQRLAVELTILSAAPADDACRVALFKDYYDFYGRVHEAYLERLSPLDGSSPKLAAIKRELAAVDWVIGEGEAGYSVSDGPAHWLEKNATANLPETWKQYLALVQKDVEEGFAEDAGLSITWQQLRERLRRWEDFVAANATFDKKALREIRADHERFLRTLLNGLDNSPIYDEETGVLRKDVKVELEAYIADTHAASRETVRKFYALVKANHWKRSDAAQVYLTKKKLVWPGTASDGSDE